MTQVFLVLAHRAIHHLHDHVTQGTWSRKDRLGATHHLEVHWRINNSAVLARALDHGEPAARAYCAGQLRGSPSTERLIRDTHVAARRRILYSSRMSLYSVVSSLLQGMVFPPGILLVGLLLGGIAVLSGRWRLAFAVIAAPLAVTLVLAVPWVGDRIVTPLEQRALVESRSALASRPLPRTAVVLGGLVGIAGPDDQAAASGYDLSGAADRVVAAARLWRTGQVDRIVLAGGTGAAISEAELMARFAVDLGVPRAAMVLEGESRTTRENALRVAATLRDNRLGTDIALVTSAMHLPRAMAEFRCAGLLPVGVPAEFEVLGGNRGFAEDWIPSLGAIDRSRRGLKEWLGATVGGCS